MKKVLSIALILMNIFIFSACNSKIDINSYSHATKSISESLLGVINNRQPFITESNTEITLGEYNIPDILTGSEFLPLNYTFVDLDGDGTDELVVSETQQNFYLILRFNAEDGKIYGYSLKTRAFIDVKTDGTFLQSSSAGINAVSKISFDGASLSISEMAFKNDVENVFEIDNKPVNKKNAEKYFTEWSAKKSSVWITINS